jgi:hypothetical protein
LFYYLSSSDIQPALKLPSSQLLNTLKKNMKKILVCACIFALASCNSEDKKEAEAKTASTETGTTMPYSATYSSKFEMGDAKNSETIMKAWKAFDDGNLASVRNLFADSLDLYLRDGSEMHGQTDTLMVGVQAFRNSVASNKSTVHAYLSVKSTDMNENWVSIWGTEVSTDKQGKTDSVGLAETWRLNKDGKINLMYQFGRALTAPPMQMAK